MPPSAHYIYISYVKPLLISLDETITYFAIIYFYSVLLPANTSRLVLDYN